MSETLEYYQEAVLIDGRPAASGAGRLKLLVDARTLSTLAHATRRRQTVGEAPRPVMNSLGIAAEQGRQIYPMQNGAGRRTPGSRQVVRGRR